ncbi:MAG: NAD+ synthase [Planctomycetota bacterium]
MNYPELIDYISDWIRSQTREADMRGVVLGLSGGIDSAVVLALAKKALGDDVLGVLMPCESEERDMEDALEVAELFDAETLTVRLDGLYEDFLLELPEEGGENARSNLKPRLRMTTLYYLANSRNALVCGTGNRSELAVGYFTKYGDGGADMLPIGGLLKMQVRAVAAELGIPERIIHKAPTAGLWPGQTDEAELGMGYDTLDEIVDALQNERTPEADPEDVRQVKVMMNNARHKRQMPPVCPLPEPGATGATSR